MSTATNSPNVIDYTPEFLLALEKLERIATAAAASAVFLERIAIAEEGIMQCCRSGRVDNEAFLEINMRYHAETPEERWARYEALAGGGS